LDAVDMVTGFDVDSLNPFICRHSPRKFIFAVLAAVTRRSVLGLVNSKDKSEFDVADRPLIIFTFNGLKDKTAAKILESISVVASKVVGPQLMGWLSPE
jgi:hypothetical protein